MASDQIEKITTHPHFEKYSLWLVTGKTAPEIRPDFTEDRKGARHGLKPTIRGYRISARVLGSWVYVDYLPGPANQFWLFAKKISR